MKKLQKNKKSFHMLDEIYEQPRIVQSLLDNYLNNANDKVKMKEFQFKLGKLHKIKRFVFLACGSSAHASLLGNYYFEEFTEKNCEYEYADEFISRRAVIEPGTAVVLLSQSGKTKDVLIAAEIARQKGAFIIAISNTPGSKLERMSDVFFDTSAGEEKAMAATKSFSSQLIILFLMSLYFADIFDVGIKDRKEVFKELKSLTKK